LVIGSGDGEPALLLAREFPAARVRGVDSSLESVRGARAKVGLDPEGRVAFKVGKPGALPYPDELFDLVAQIDGRPAPAEIARVLRPGAHLILVHSRRPGLAAGLWARRIESRLARRRIEILQRESAGDGNFLVARLTERR